MATFWVENDPGDDGKADGDLFGSWLGNRLIGAGGKKGTVKGPFEYGKRMNVRLLFGTWDTAKGILLFGQPDPLFGADLYGNQIYNERVELETESDLGKNDEVKLSYPTFRATLRYRSENFFVDGFTGYQNYDIDTGTNNFFADSYVYGIGGGFKVGPGYVRASIYLAQNQGEYKLVSGISGEVENTGSIDNPLFDNATVGGLVVVGGKLNDMVAFEVGYGMTSNGQDAPSFEDDYNTLYYFQVPITLAPGFFVMPEAGKFDFKEEPSGKDEGEQTYFGAKWQINF